MSFKLGRRFVGMFVAFAMLTAGVASAEFGPPGPGPGGYNPPGFNPPGFGPGNPAGFNPPGFNPGFGPGPRPLPVPPVGGPGLVGNPPGVGPGNPPGVGPGIVVPPGVAPIAGGTYNVCSKRYEEAWGPVKQPNHSPMMKHWECLNQLSADYLKELKGLTNLQVTDLQFTQAVVWGNPQILWSAEAIANRKMNIAKSWARAMEMSADASWQFFKGDKNICDFRCTQSYMNFIFTMNNTMFFSRDFDWYMRWQYDMSNWSTGGADIRNGAHQAAMGHLNALKQLAVQIAHETRVIELAPVVQEGFRMFTAAVPGMPWVQGQPFCAYAYGTPYLGQAYFPYYNVPNVGRVFVPQPTFPFIAQEYLPRGYEAALMPNQFYSNNYTTILNTNVEAVPAPIGDTYISNNEWVNQTDSYYQQHPIQNPRQPSVGYNDYSQRRMMNNMQRYQGLPAQQQQQMGPTEYPNYEFQGQEVQTQVSPQPQLQPQPQRGQYAPPSNYNNGSYVPQGNNGNYVPQGTIGGRVVTPTQPQTGAPQVAPQGQSNTGSSSEWDWGGAP